MLRYLSLSAYLAIGLMTVFAVVLEAPAVGAEVLLLKNGRRIEVDRFWEEGEQVFYERNGSVFGFPRSLLRHVERDALEPAPRPRDADIKPPSRSHLRNETASRELQQARRSVEEGNTEEASRWYRAAIASSPDSVVGHVELAELLMRRGDLLEAQSQLEQAKWMNPEEPTVRTLLGDVYYQRGRTPLAIREWQKALELEPSSAVLDKLKRALRENDQDIVFDEIEGPHFVIRYDGTVNEAIGRRVATALEYEYDELIRALDFSPQAPIRVTLYTQREFTEATHAPSWASAVNDGEIRIPVEGLTELTDPLRALLRHELTHSFVNARTRGNCPTWFHEGLAQWHAETAPSELYDELRHAREEGRLFPIWSLEGQLLGYSREDARIAYLQALAVTQYLVERRGREGLNRILSLLAARQTMNDALKNVIGLDYQELQTAWEADLDRPRARVPY